MHVVKKYISKKKDQDECSLWNGYKVSFEFNFIFLRIIVDWGFAKVISVKIKVISVNLKIKTFSIITGSVKLLL